MPQGWTAGPAPKVEGWTAGPAPKAEETAAPPLRYDTRAAIGAKDAVVGMAKLAAKASGVPGLFREGALGALKDQFEVAKQLFYDPVRDQLEKAHVAQNEGRPGEMALRSVAAGVPLVGPGIASTVDEFRAGRGPEAVGALAVGAMIPELAGEVGSAAAALKPEAFAARAAAKVPKAIQTANADLRLAFPKADIKAIEKARPYINEQLGGKAPANTQELFDALGKASSGIESKVRSLLEEFPADRIEPKITETVTRELQAHPRKDFVTSALKEIESLDLDAPRSPLELDDIRKQLNAENQSVMERTGSKRATARKTDAGFAAREIAADAIRDQLYGHMERRGVPGIAELRRDQGALINFKSAVERQLPRGANKVAGTAPDSVARKVAAFAVGDVAPVPGIVAKPIARAIKGSPSTRDALVSRAFQVGNDRLPTYPQAPVRPKIAGELPPAQTQLRSPDTSGPIEPTLPQHYVEEKAALDEIVPSMTATVPAEENAFVLRWMADDLREMNYEPGSRMSRAQRMQEYEKATSNEAYGKATYTGRVAGTPLQEMFHAAGIKGTRKEIAAKLDRFMQTGKGDSRIGGLVEAMREAWDGQRFDFENVSDETLAKAGIRRRDLRSPVTTPYPDDMPGVYEKWFQKSGEDEMNFDPMEDQ